MMFRRYRSGRRQRHRRRVEFPISMASRISARLGEDRGSALVEFAVVFPLLIVLVMGIISFGQAFRHLSAIDQFRRRRRRGLCRCARKYAEPLYDCFDRRDEFMAHSRASESLVYDYRYPGHSGSRHALYPRLRTQRSLLVLARLHQHHRRPRRTSCRAIT